MMPDELNPLAGSENENKPTPTTDPEPATEEKPKVFDEKYVQDLRKEAESRRKELRAAEKERDELKAAQETERKAKLTANQQFEELTKAQETELNNLKAKLAETELKGMRNQIALEFKLTPTVAKRLQGSTEDELRADAQALIEELGLNKAAEAPATPPPATTPNPARRQTTVVAPGGQPGETDDEKRARLYKQGAQNSPLFQSNE